MVTRTKNKFYEHHKQKHRFFHKSDLQKYIIYKYSVPPPPSTIIKTSINIYGITKKKWTISLVKMQHMQNY